MPVTLGRVMRLTLAVILVLAGGGPARAGEAVAYRLKWLFNSSVAGDLYAWDRGVFAAQGLEVTVKAGGPERDAIKELELNQAQFGVASADQVLRALDKGARVAVVAQLFQINPLQWIYRADRGPINALARLRGLTIGVTYGGNDETIMRTLLAMAGLGERDVTLFSVRYDFTPFYQNRVDIWPMYRNSQGIVIAQRMQAEGETVRFFNPADFGVRFVANSVVTRQQLVDERPDLVRRFVRALLAGWREAMAEENQALALATIARHDRETPPDLMAPQLAETRLLVRPAPDFPVGRIDVAAWRQTEAIMVQQGLIGGPVNVTERLFPPEDF
jgi:NitT/TauT family transport system substrate-binding protein